MIAYLHNMSPIKTSQRNNLYFDMTLQTENGCYRTVCFSPEKHSHFLSRYESSSPVKLNKFQVKRNARTNKDEIHINKRTKLDDPQESEVCFDIKELPTTETCKPGLTSVSDVINGGTNVVANVCGRVTLQGSTEDVIAKGKTLRKQEALFTDNSGTIRLVLWESDIGRVTNASTYQISKVVVKEYEKTKYLTLNKASGIKLSDASITRKDTLLQLAPSLKSVCFPADGVQSLQRFISCTKCQTKLLPDNSKKIVKCTECGLVQLKPKCSQRLLANTLFQNNGEATSLLLFDDKLKQLYEVYQGQTDDEKSFESLDDDSLMEFLLTVEATAHFNQKKTVVAIQKKNN